MLPGKQEYYVLLGNCKNIQTDDVDKVSSVTVL